MAVTDRVVGMAKAVVEKVVELKTNATNKFNEIKDSITQAITNAKDKVTSAVGGMKDAVRKKFDEIVDWVRNIPRRITNALGNLGDLLWNSGSSIISGLLSGMRNAADSMFNWVSGIAGTIASLKGPLPYDRKVLVGNGIALMHGLQKGLEEGFENEVKPYVSGLAMDVNATMVPAGAPDAIAAKSAPVVQVGELVVREEADIYRIAEQLYNLSNRGGVAWSTSYSMA
jgi:phage-related protein